MVDEATKLTAKQGRFVEEYCIDYNATQACIRAGYSKRSAQQQGSENLSKPVISLAIKERLDDLSMSSEEALRRLTNFARGSMSDFIRLNEDGEPVVVVPMTEDGVADPDALALIKKVKVRTQTTGRGETALTTTTTEFELEDRQSAIDKMLKARQAYGGKLELTGADGGPVEITKIERVIVKPKGE